MTDLPWARVHTIDPDLPGPDGVLLACSAEGCTRLAVLHLRAVHLEAGSGGGPDVAAVRNFLADAAPGEGAKGALAGDQYACPDHASRAALAAYVAATEGPQGAA